MREIQITQDGLTTLIDDEDYDLVNQFNWMLQEPKPGARYAVSVVNHKLVGVHRLIMGTIHLSGKIIRVDHIDRNGLNNRRDNLRLATVQQNAFNRRMNYNNTTGFKGVSYHKRDKRWRAHTRFNGVLIHIGCFGSPEEASEAYIQKTAELHGEFALVQP